MPNLDGSTMKFIHQLLDLKRKKCARNNAGKFDIHVFTYTFIYLHIHSYLRLLVASIIYFTYKQIHTLHKYTDSEEDWILSAYPIELG
jgi:hypothetical protein